MKSRLIFTFLLLISIIPSTAQTMKLPRVIVSTDIGGTDPDDNQSMAHLLMFSDKVDIEGLISSPSYGNGSVNEIHRMIDLYAQDLPLLQQHVNGLKEPAYLHSITKQGRHGRMPLKGYATATEGSNWIVKCARRDDSRPLWVLVWGGLDDVAQALHDAPDIAERIRVVYIGGPNKKWGANSYNYIAKNFPKLWMIENNSSYEGFIGDKKKHDPLNADYYDSFIKGAGHLGADFANYYKGLPKMGDTPTLLYVMSGNPDDPTGESWGGSFEPTNRSSRKVMHAPLTLSDTIAVYGLMEIHFKGPRIKINPDSACFRIKVAKQWWDGYYTGKGDYVAIYSPKAPGTLDYVTESKIKALNGLKGQFVVTGLWPGNPSADDYRIGPNWFTDRKDSSLFERWLQGAKTVRKWRDKAMALWAQRWAWLIDERK